jgi:hypothetical protein
MSPAGKSHSFQAAQIAAWRHLWVLLLRPVIREGPKGDGAAADRSAERFTKED